MSDSLTVRFQPTPDFIVRSPLFWAGVGLQLCLIVVLFLFQQPVMVLGVAITLLLGVLILLDPRMIFFSITFITFVFHSDAIGHGYIIHLLGFNWYAMDWILFFAWCSWAIRWSLGINPPLQRTVITRAVSLFLLVLVACALISLNRGNRIQDVFADMRLFFYYSSYFLCLLFIQDFKDIEVVFWSMIACGIAGSIPEIIGSLSQSQFDVLTGKALFFKRITGYHEVNYPLLLVASIVMFPFVQNLGKKLLLIVSCAVSALALFLSYTRGSWLAAAAGLFITFFFFSRQTVASGKNSFKLLVAIFGVIGLLFALDLLGIFTFTTLAGRIGVVSFRQIDISSLERVTEWQYAWDLFLRHPVFGVGLGFIYRFNAVGIGRLEQIFIHNSYLYVLSKMGIVGFTAFLFLYLSVLRAARQSVKRLTEKSMVGMALAFTSMVFVLLVKSITTWHLNTLTTSLFLGVILGIIGVLHSKTAAGRARAVGASTDAIA
jgi:O-antigen ligase